MLPAASTPKAPRLLMRDTRSGSLIQVMAPHMMGSSVPRKSLPRFQILSSWAVDLTGVSALMAILPWPVCPAAEAAALRRAAGVSRPDQ